jgi:HIV Tat-specific factor 1
LLDGSDYKGHKIRVEKAKFEMKGNYDAKKHVHKEAAQKKLNKTKEKKLLDKQRQKYWIFSLF